MNIDIIAVGKIKEKYLSEGVAEYMKRLSRFCRISVAAVDDEKAPEGISAAEENRIRHIEGERILARIREGSCKVALDVKGTAMDSEKFADMLRKQFLSGKPDITFIIGGSIGLGGNVLQNVDLKLSMSAMTFPHQLTRIILLEQVYRAFKIINNEPYHK
ncbi:MAG: 23S rRNA (pseudouridine(1915)-N(3))-methyltransferase RlmH [Eubacteriales bacterium]|nr:23S rRNA (pseudouridine(1915)-N(3))-methyltransferase RlmH [Eubacteriales bacterium]